mgnify:CR=1 FL=1
MVHSVVFLLTLEKPFKHLDLFLMVMFGIEHVLLLHSPLVLVYFVLKFIRKIMLVLFSSKELVHKHKHIGDGNLLKAV